MEDYKQHLLARGLAMHSVEGYERAVGDWLKWLGDKLPTRLLAEEYLTFKGLACGMKPSTLAHRVTSIRCFYDYKVDIEKSMTENPWKTVRKPKLPPRFPRVLNHEQCLSLIAQPMRSWRNGIMVSKVRRATI